MRDSIFKDKEKVVFSDSQIFEKNVNKINEFNNDRNKKKKKRKEVSNNRRKESSLVSNKVTEK